MKNKKFINELMSFIQNCTCSFTSVEEIKKTLIKNGYVELKEEKEWELKSNKIFVTRNDASIIAVQIPEIINNSFSIITTHCDTPALLLKPNGAFIKNKYLKYNIAPYGGLLNYGWLDHPLSIAGRVIIKKNNRLLSKIIDLKKPFMIVPSVAIHQNDAANSNLDLNMQTDLQPIVGLSKDKKQWESIIEEEIKEKIIDYDLFAYNIDNSFLLGKEKELLVSPRIDNLTSVYSGLNSFLNSTSSNIKIFCSFNNEETGSLSEEGADSNFLLNVLKRICSCLNINIASALRNSFIINSDNTHAIHPNHEEFADDTGILYLGEGFSVIREEGSATSGLSSSIIQSICKKHKIKYQVSTSKNDIAGGSTLSAINLRHVSVLSADIGIPQLAMHSSLEVACITDIINLYRFMESFYSTTIVIKDNDIQLRGN